MAPVVVPAVHRPMADAAAAAAESAARAGGVRLRELHELVELERLGQLYQEIWATDPAVGPMVTTEWLRALEHAGNYVTGAYAGDKLVGGCIGFFAAPVGRVLHSHVAGVAAGMRGRNVGFALKLHQREWALRRGITEITWTFDPLVRRNAYFNLAKLGALPVTYLANFYGSMSDQINAGEESDRILVSWRLEAPPVVRACAGRPREVDLAALRAGGAVVGLDTDGAGRPKLGSVAGDLVLVAVPPDVERQRLEDRQVARAWRHALREVLAGLVGGGAAVTGFAREGWYVVARGSA